MKKHEKPTPLRLLDEAKEINEEIQSLMFPLLTAVENEAESDTYFMLRAVSRLLKDQFIEFERLAEVTK
ncbi:MAG: hypothetical protein PV362_10225 [Providencia heimbachae]|uniref:hypothetical protein n=1 Tax=Providencia heimbachae TaxID=333962 RepID=UPI0010BE6324|nr:hypothetical protein [Providencia heimbachae]QCJ70628.1 hypothetical protein C9446_12660 [Providencia heimbachae]